ncbi:MAG: hypothetical protein R2710_25085 [Acidimicrobiales bacterium]
MSKIVSDPRIDPRIKATMGAMPESSPSDVADRDTLLAQNNTPEAKAMQAMMVAGLDMLGPGKTLRPPTGSTSTSSSSPRSPMATR